MKRTVFFIVGLACASAGFGLVACGGNPWTAAGFEDRGGGGDDRNTGQQSKVIVNNTNRRMCSCEAKTCFCLEPGASITIYY